MILQWLLFAQPMWKHVHMPEVSFIMHFIRPFNDVNATLLTTCLALAWPSMAEARTSGAAATADAPPAGKLTQEQHLRIEQVRCRNVDTKIVMAIVYCHLPSTRLPGQTFGLPDSIGRQGAGHALPVGTCLCFVHLSVPNCVRTYAFKHAFYLLGYLASPFSPALPALRKGWGVHGVEAP